MAIAQGIFGDRFGRRAKPGSVRQTRFARPVFQTGLLLWVPVFLAIGIGLWLAMPYEPGLRDCALLAAMALLPLLIWSRAPSAMPRLSDLLLALSLAGLVVCAGFSLATWRAMSVAAPVLQWRYYGPVEGRVVGIDRASTDKMRILLDNVVLHDTAPMRTPGLVRISLPSDATDRPQPGQRVMVTANLGPPPGPTEPGGFDFRRHAWFQGLGAIGYTRTRVLTVEPPPDVSAALLDRWRMAVSVHIQSRIPGQSGAVVAALFTGDRCGILEDTNRVMRAANLYHIVSISGLHMAMVAGFSYQLFRWGLVLCGLAIRQTGRRLVTRIQPHHGAAIGALIASAGYLWLSGGGVATERAFIMVAVMLGAIIAGRRAISLRSVALAAIIILFMAPETLVSAGFQMSFSATIALIVIARIWPRITPHIPTVFRPVIMLVLTSFVAGLATAPFAAANFGRVPHYGLLANLLAVPVMGSVVMPAGIIAALLGVFGLAGPALWVAGLGTRWMLAVAEWVAGLDGATSMVRTPPPWVVPLLALGLIVPLLVAAGRPYGAIQRHAAAAACIGVLLAFWGWNHHARPKVLISDTGDAVGIIGADGLRVPSKDKGGGYVVARWLEGDGDAAPQKQAAQRPGWEGPRHRREARLGPDLRLVHLTGTRSPDLAPDLCRAGMVVVSNQRLDIEAPECILLDADALRRTGAISLTHDPRQPGRVVLETAQQKSGARFWAGLPR